MITPPGQPESLDFQQKHNEQRKEVREAEEKKVNQNGYKNGKKKF